MKAAKHLLYDIPTRQDFALLLAQASAEAPGAIVMAPDHNGTPHYLVGPAGAAAIQELLATGAVNAASLQQMRRRAQPRRRTPPKEIQRRVLMLLEAGQREANTGELLVEYQNLTPCAAAATTELRDALAAYSASPKAAEPRARLRAALGKWSPMVPVI